MKAAKDGVNWFFVDESGDPTFYDADGKLIVGQGGCSPLLILGFIETANPTFIRQSIAEAHAQIASDSYLNGIMSFAESKRTFHAKNDAPEVRQVVFKAIHGMDFKAQFVVARKRELVFRQAFNSNTNAFYDHLVTLLFENVLHRHSQNKIYFSQRGTRARRVRLEEAIQASVAKFETKWNVKMKSEIEIISQTMMGEPCLQVIDYMNWAVYRAFVKREMRYYQFVQDKVSLLVDRYDHAKYPRNYYTRENPFNIEKASPL